MRVSVIGDSHADFYFRPLPGFDVTAVGGATALGAVNPNSATNALQIFREHLAKHHNYDFIMVVLGEVDCGFVIWHRAEQKGIPIREQLELSTANLFSFIDTDVRRYYRPEQIIVVGSVPPTIRDDQPKGRVAGLRRSIRASQLSRTTLTAQYNYVLKREATQRGMHYVDIFMETLAPVTGLVDDKYRNEDPDDHHLSFRATRHLWEAKLKPILQAGGSQAAPDPGRP